jgi:hypothetical protein
MKIKKEHWIVFAIIMILLITGIILRFALGGDEDSWIKDSRGVYVKHGNPSLAPNYVTEQGNAINCALGKFNNFTEEKNSQCLGTCGNYSVDIVHVPRTAEDNLAENQCEDYMNYATSYFIELDQNGEVVRIA